MSFSKKVKSEIGKDYPSARHCQIAELSAFFLQLGKIKQRKNGKNFLILQSENLTVIRKSYKLLEESFHANMDIRIRKHSTSGDVLTYALYVFEESDVKHILMALKIIDRNYQFQGYTTTVQPLLVQNTCCKRAFLRGMFLVAGSVSDPEKAYHLEIAVLSEKLVSDLQKMIACFQIDAKIVERKKYYVLYIKEGAQIVDFLNVIEAHVALMDYENVRIVKEVRNSVNRQVNCETANINKTVTAAAHQIEDIKYIQQNIGLQQLTDALREMAELRLNYPDCSLQELGKMLTPPIGKSGVNHRLRKLSEMASKLKEKKEKRSLKKEENDTC